MWSLEWTKWILNRDSISEAGNWLSESTEINRVSLCEAENGPSESTGMSRDNLSEA